ncbi:MAG: hypothetical protein HYY06_14885 [Deltaproteobacteria bacterium]|nr:hypothetical protein [Deltaproteobacteria bacterium]
MKAHFEAALTLDPLNDQIRENRDAFEREAGEERAPAAVFLTEQTQLKLLEEETAGQLTSGMPLAA